MKTEIVSSNSVKEDKFPLIAKGKSGLTVLFTKEIEGIVLVKGFTVHKIGSFHIDWISCFDFKEWEILEEVTITFKS